MILFDILEEHLEEADFLFHQRENALSDRVYDLDGLAELEERLLAHLDGLVLGGKEAWKLLEPKLAEGELGEVFGAAFVALESGETARIDLAQKTFAEAEGEILDGVRHALRHASSPDIEKIVRPFLSAEKASVRAAAIDVLSFRRVPIDINLLRLAFSGKDPLARAAAANAAGRLRIGALKSEVEAALEGASPQVRREAISAGLLLKSEQALACCRKAISAKSEEAGEALLLLGLAGHPEDEGLLVHALGEKDLARTAIISLGFLGRSAAIDPLIRSAADPKLARPAGEAIHLLTGVNLKKENLIAPPPSETKSEKDDDDFDADPDEGLPFPDPAKLAVWWKANAARFDKTARYRGGQPHGPQLLIDILKTGPLPDRHHAAIELARIDPSRPYIETRAFTTRQRQEMNGL